jgi:hypothetical protein
MSQVGDLFDGPPLSSPSLCERCGRRIEAVPLGSRTNVCGACSPIVQEQEKKRAQAGSPSETAFRREVSLGGDEFAREPYR